MWNHGVDYAALLEDSGAIERVLYWYRKAGLDVEADLEVEPGEFVVLLGPGGCGKTTLLRSIAGFETPDSGSIQVNGTPVFDGERGTCVSPERRNLSMMFRSYALWPHMTAELGAQYPAQLSGGQQQRVALARALVNDSRTAR